MQGNLKKENRVRKSASNVCSSYTSHLPQCLGTVTKFSTEQWQISAIAFFLDSCRFLFSADAHYSNCSGYFDLMPCTLFYSGISRQVNPSTT